MGTLAVDTHALAENVEFTDGDMVVSLVDGRKIIIPLVWFPRLTNATKSQLGNFELLGDDEGIICEPAGFCAIDRDKAR